MLEFQTEEAIKPLLAIADKSEEKFARCSELSLLIKKTTEKLCIKFSTYRFKLILDVPPKIYCVAFAFYLVCYQMIAIY